ncbi:4198_t:CDS:2 [Diversispora eburnea]|uniref:4198_t:CDS:1 n=1 Tax=Diversispora eburnea TaxID=1213867 RepID=A0A9N9F7N4_9GLOM|nr:4198_t:CDS:2 [Diversispora eburnea]
MKFLSLICLIGLIYTVQAGIYTNTPYVGVTWTGGSSYPINWVDDNNKPSLTELDNLTIELCAGTEKNHHFVATIGKAKGIAKTITYSVPTKIGPEGDFYFIKYHQGDNIYFSARFTIKGISGTIPDFDPSNPDKPVISTKKESTSSSSSTKDSTTKTTVNTATATGKNKNSAINSASRSNGSQINCSYSFLFSFLTIAALASLVY